MSKNNVLPCILWTESKRIVNYFNLQGRVHISWDKELKRYKVVRYIKKTLNVDITTEEKETELSPVSDLVSILDNKNIKWSDLPEDAEEPFDNVESYASVLSSK